MTTDPAHIAIRGARQHNLQGIDVDIPRNQLVVITGLSGSGKSTLAFDTLYAEGQRRYVESLSTYARQFLERLEKPEVDHIDGLSPAIAIEQKTAGHNPRSTVGTVTEIYDYLRVLYARIGIAHCHHCGVAIAARTAESMVEEILALPDSSRILVMAPLNAIAVEDWARQIAQLQKDGFARIRLDEQIIDIEEAVQQRPAAPQSIDVVVDRLVVNPTIQNRLTDSVELALSIGDGHLAVAVIDGMTHHYSEAAVCPNGHMSAPPLSPASFSFNSPHGACPGCNGLGTTTIFDESLIIPNPDLCLRDGAVAVWANRSSVHFTEFLDALTAQYGVDIYTPYRELPDHFKDVLLRGSGETAISHYFQRDGGRRTYEKPFEGLIPMLERRYLETDSTQSREDLRPYMLIAPCPECRGERLNPSSRAVRVTDSSLPMLTAQTVSACRSYLAGMTLPAADAAVADRICREIDDRLGFLEHVGLGYLTLNRPAATLSGGESQRIRLATQIGARLTGVLYVLDEPSIGLHQRDHTRLLAALIKMRDLGNTVLVVEHDLDTINQADHVIDMGPGAGVNGGQVIYSGPPDRIASAEGSLTGDYIAGRRSIARPDRRRSGNGYALTVYGATTHNLANIDVSFPLGTLVCVTGVSGSGKSSLVNETLVPALIRHLTNPHYPAGGFRSISGLEHVDKVVAIDQSPIGKTPRSNPATYCGVFTPIRDLYSRTPEARARGYRPGRFSFNVKGGRCEACQGDGTVRIEMHFLPDVYVTCDRCGGRRYNRETLNVRYKGKTIADALDMTINTATDFFNRVPAIRGKLDTLVEVGLGYVRLGQPAPTLSGGEAQRVKLAKELSRRDTGRTVYVLDEPTTGLHMEDVRRLLGVLDQLVEAGNTVIIIEHHLDVIKCADYVIDLGPEGGDAGGRLVGCGSPEQIAAVSQSHTGRFLAPVLDADHPPGTPVSE